MGWDMYEFMTDNECNLMAVWEYRSMMIQMTSTYGTCWSGRAGCGTKNTPCFTEWYWMMKREGNKKVLKMDCSNESMYDMELNDPLMNSKWNESAVVKITKCSSFHIIPLFIFGSNASVINLISFITPSSLPHRSLTAPIYETSFGWKPCQWFHSEELGASTEFAMQIQFPTSNITAWPMSTFIFNSEFTFSTKKLISQMEQRGLRSQWFMYHCGRITCQSSHRNQ